MTGLWQEVLKFVLIIGLLGRKQIYYWGMIMVIRASRLEKEGKRAGVEKCCSERTG